MYTPRQRKYPELDYTNFYLPSSKGEPEERGKDISEIKEDRPVFPLYAN